MPVVFGVGRELEYFADVIDSEKEYFNKFQLSRIKCSLCGEEVGE